MLVDSPHELAWRKALTATSSGDEMFVFPFLNFQRPTLARTLLEYRIARLGAARAAARAAGFAGAMLPWQSGSTGREETQQLHLNPKFGRWLPDHTHLQRHVNIAIAYNVWQHYMVTGNIGFLRFAGAELLIEIARFWSSIATYNAELDRYEILGVMGPDEYHEKLPGLGRAGAAQQHLHQRHGRVGAPARWRRWRSCRRTTGRSWPTS